MATSLITTGRTVKQLLRPHNLLAAWTDMKRSTQELSRPVLTVSSQLHLAIDWLLSAYAATDQTGFAAHYSLSDGWGEAYPETTGYIIPTLLSYLAEEEYRSADIKQAVINAGEWLLSIQQASGAFPGYGSNQPMVFDTGQIIFGLNALYRTTQDRRYLLAAERAGDWLANEQEISGIWIKHSLNQAPHVYYACVSWALLDLHQLSNKPIYRSAAIKNLDWVISEQQSNGWFNYFSFVPGSANLHTISYTLQGLLSAAEILDEAKYQEVARLTADRLLELNKIEILSGPYNNQWQSVGRSRCLTGLAQMGLVWRQLFQVTQDIKYKQAAGSTFAYLQTVQVVSERDPKIKGALAGSAPIWGDYLPFSYPNWATKYFVDLGLLLKGDLAIPNSVLALKELTQIFQQAQVKYWLNMGTLLGAVREGKLISGDLDIDLGVTIEEVTKILPLLPTLGERGWRVDVTTFSIFFSKPAQGILIELIIYQHHQDKLWTPLLKILPRGNTILKYADLIAERALYREYHQNIPKHHRWTYQIIPAWFNRPLRKGLFNLLTYFGQHHYAMAFPEQLLTTLKSAQLYGVDFPTPSPAVDYLATIYGSDWQIPRSDWRIDMVPAIDRTIFDTKDQAKYNLI